MHRCLLLVLGCFHPVRPFLFEVTCGFLAQFQLHSRLTLRLLEIFISLNALSDYAHVWVYFRIKSLDKVCYVFVALPALDPLEQAHVRNNSGGAPRNTRGAMDVDIQALVVQHIV